VKPNTSFCATGCVMGQTGANGTTNTGQGLSMR